MHTLIKRVQLASFQEEGSALPVAFRKKGTNKLTAGSNTLSVAHIKRAACYRCTAAC